MHDMADSLRDQLIAAGFEAPKKPAKKPATKVGKKTHSKKRGPNTGRKSSASNKAGRQSNIPGKQSKAAAAEAEVLERKKLKAQIKELIDTHKLEDWKGEIAYRYTVDKRIRELYVNEAAQKKLTAREASITRLNGDTYLVPLEIATEIVKINPQWSVFNASDEPEGKSDENDGDYAEFQVPDDLQW